jgi:hypothetical protein
MFDTEEEEDRDSSRTQKCRWCGAEFHDNEELFRFHEGLHLQTGAGASEEKWGHTIQKLNEKKFKKNNAIDRHYVVKLNSDVVRAKRKVRDVQNELSRMFDAALNESTENLRDSDLIRIIIHSDSLITPIFVPLRKIEDMTSSVIMDHINHVLTSHEDMPVDESFYVDIGTIQVPSGEFIPPFFLFLLSYLYFTRKEKRG